MKRLTIRNYRKLEDKDNIKTVIEEEDKYIIRYDDREIKAIIHLNRIDRNNLYKLELVSDNKSQRVKILQINEIKNIEVFYHIIEVEAWNM